jgi:hypothetical protein
MPVYSNTGGSQKEKGFLVFQFFIFHAHMYVIHTYRYVSLQNNKY